MKKWLLGLLAAMMAVSLAACTPTTEKQKETKSVAEAQTQMEAQTTGGASDKVPDPNVAPVAIISIYHKGRLSVNVKKIYVGGNDIGVYLIASGQEIPLGNIFIRNGCGEFRTIINVENVMGTGNSLDSCIGLVIHEKGEEWRVYKTVWEDAVAQAAELELAEAAEKKPDDTQERDKRLKKQIEELNREIDEAAKVDDNIAEKENVERNSPWRSKSLRTSGRRRRKMGSGGALGPFPETLSQNAGF